jgi:tetratricopeptide (TPR) repeat protein
VTARLLDAEHPPRAADKRIASGTALTAPGALETLRHIDRALTLEPENPELLLLRAQHLLAVGELRRARDAASAAQRRAPADPRFFDALGAVYTRANDQPHALEAYDRAARLDPDNPRLLFNRAAVRRFVGALEEAEADYDRVIALDPDDYEACKNRSDLRTQTADRNHIAELESLLRRGTADWRGEVQLRFALAKEYEDLGAYEQSFRHLERGARLRRVHMRYDVGLDVATVDWIREAFPQVLPEASSRSARGASAAPTGEPVPIFIVGLPRSGSTVVDRILGSHSKVVSAGELSCFAEALVEAVQRRAGGAPLPRRELVARSATLDFRALGLEYLRRARAAGVGVASSFFIDKMPLNFLYCGLIRRALPHARIVHVHRSPLGACYALYKSLFEDGYPYSYDLGEIGRYYVAYRRLTDHWNRTLPGTIHSLSYERLVADQLGETRRLLEFCGLEWEDGCLEFHRNPAPTTTASAAQVRRPLYASSVAQWHHYEEQLRALRDQLQAAGISCDEDATRLDLGAVPL